MAVISKFNKSIAVVAATIGLSAAAILVPFVAGHEGEVLQGYLDPVGVATKCYGDTNDVVAGKAYTQDECLQSLASQLVAHAEPVLVCAPGVASSPEMTAAFVSLAYNIGTSAFCRSTVVRLYKAGDYAGACAAIEMWKYAGGKALPGLVKRRADERRLCERGVPAMGSAL